MIPLQPSLSYHANCVHDHTPLDVSGWSIPGMRCLAELSCSACGREYFGDLRVGEALASPMLLEADTGHVYDSQGTSSPSYWFSDWLQRGYVQRVDAPVDWTIETARPVRRPLLLDCLNALYGHSLLSLLNAQHYIDHARDWDLIVLIPHQLRWLVPDGAAEIWSVPWSFRQGFVWNDGLAAQIRERLARYDECALSIGIPNPHADDWDVRRFSRIPPFAPPVDGERVNHPVISFIWRDDRTWPSLRPANRFFRASRRLATPLRLVKSGQQHQQDRFVAVAEELKHNHPDIDAAIIGLGTPQPGLPAWIDDRRTLTLDENTERAWCGRYAQSHVVIGVHGSNMLLPSAHAGAAVELVPRDRWSNLMQDILLPEADARTFALRCRFLPEESQPATVAAVVETVLSVPDWIPLCSPAAAHCTDRDR